MWLCGKCNSESGPSGFGDDERPKDQEHSSLGLPSLIPFDRLHVQVFFLRDVQWSNPCAVSILASRKMLARGKGVVNSSESRTMA